jgi:hypothetical protein
LGAIEAESIAKCLQGTRYCVDAPHECYAEEIIILADELLPFMHEVSAETGQTPDEEGVRMLHAQLQPLDFLHVLQRMFGRLPPHARRVRLRSNVVAVDPNTDFLYFFRRCVKCKASKESHRLTPKTLLTKLNVSHNNIGEFVLAPGVDYSKDTAGEYKYWRGDESYGKDPPPGCGPIGAVALANALEDNNTLQHLLASNSSMAALQTGVAFADLLKGNTALRTLDLSNSARALDLDQEGPNTREARAERKFAEKANVVEFVCALANGLVANKTLSVLDLRASGIPNVVPKEVGNLTSAEIAIAGKSLEGPLLDALAQAPSMCSFSGIPIQRLRMNSICTMNLRQAGLTACEGSILGVFLKGCSSITSANLLDNDFGLQSR